jgi:hypothetical protein
VSTSTRFGAGTNSFSATTTITADRTDVGMLNVEYRLSGDLPGTHRNPARPPRPRHRSQIIQNSQDSDDRFSAPHSTSLDNSFNRDPRRSGRLRHDHAKVGSTSLDDVVVLDTALGQGLRQRRQLDLPSSESVMSAVGMQQFQGCDVGRFGARARRDAGEKMGGAFGGARTLLLYGLVAPR